MLKELLAKNVTHLAKNAQALKPLSAQLVKRIKCLKIKNA